MKLKDANYWDENMNGRENGVDLAECIRLPKLMAIHEVIPESESSKTFIFKHTEMANIAKPGQFIMLGVFKYLKPEESEEIPLSLSYIDPNKGTIGVTVKENGETTRALLKHRENEMVSLRGPYGNGFKIESSNVAVVGGGIGIAPLAPLVDELAKRNIQTTVFIGAKDSSDLIFINRLKSTGARVIITTEDGSQGIKGKVLDALCNELQSNKYDQIMGCGRELMMKKLVEIAEKYDIQVHLSFERLIRCGRGICGHCAIDAYLVCTDGPVFSSQIIRTLEDFGKRQLTDSGKVTTRLTF